MATSTQVATVTAMKMFILTWSHLLFDGVPSSDVAYEVNGNTVIAESDASPYRFIPSQHASVI